MSRRARARTSALGVAFFLLLIPLWWLRRPSAPAAVVRPPLPLFIFLPSTPADYPATLIRAGLDPKALAAAGVSSQTVSSVLSAAATQMNSAPNDLSNADTSYASARTQVDQLTAKIQSGQGSQDDITTLATAQSSLATATSQRQAALDAIFNAATANLSNAQKTALSTIRTNRAAWDLPLEFLVVNREQSEWVAVRDALANERIAVSLPDSLNTNAQASLATWRADPAVSSAKSSSDANLSAITTSWTSSAGH